MYGLMIALMSVLHQPTVAFAGDSVLVTVAVADNAAPQAVTVDSVEFYVEITGLINGSRSKRVAKVPGTTSAVLSYSINTWSPNQTRGGKYGARLGHTESGVTAWSAWTYVTSPGWSYTRVIAAPAQPDSTKVTNPSTGLN